MPFKLRLKKSRQYNVVSKSLFVICVELLDGNSIECTLSAESNGQECLDSVCQRLGLQQPEFFGLRYKSRHGPPELRWVEMERPLKRQLDKYAREPNLLLRVMYYVAGVNLIHDEMTRYHYFLQLKMDVIDGRMNCDPKQAVLLASYSMQAEFGNHDPERHTAEYLKDFAIFPKHLTEQGHLESLTEAVICQHIALAGLAQGTAEEYYILAAQQLEGYGQETFLAKDDSGVQVVIGVSLMGIVIGYDTSSKFYRWKDITNVINHKRHFGIECQIQCDTIQFVFPEPQAAKYVWRMCVHQHTFYMQNEQAGSEQGYSGSEQGPSGGPLFQSAEEGALTESREELDAPEFMHGWSDTPPMMATAPVQRAQSTSCLDLTTKPADMDRLRALLPSYRPAPDYETAVQLKYRNTSQAGTGLGMRPSQAGGGGFIYSSQPEIHQSHAHEGLVSYSHYKHYPDVARVKQLYLQDQQPDRLAKIPRGDYDSLALLHTYSTPELDALENSGVLHSLQVLHLYKPPPPYPSSSSTPDLASQALGPPRPALLSPQVMSGSSPDLVSSRSLGGNRLPPAALAATSTHHYPLLPNPAAHRTYTNLAAAVQPQSPTFMYPEHELSALLPLPPLPTDTRPRATTVPYMAAGPHYSEPIYENVPLPWATMDGQPMGAAAGPMEVPALRSRASSIQSAPEIRTQIDPTVGVSNSAVVIGVVSGRQAELKQQAQESHTLLQQQHHHHQQQQQQQQQQLQQQQPVLSHPQPGHHLSQHPPPLLTPPPLQQQQQQQQHQQHQQPPPSPQSHIVTPFERLPPTQGLSKNNEQRHVSKSHLLPDTSSHLESAADLDMTVSSSSGSGKGKTRRKWGLLGGAKVKSNTLTKEKRRDADNAAAVASLQHRWSTGLPRLPLPPTISKETMCQLLERKLVDSQLFFEFEKIPKKKTDADFSTAVHPDNSSRNRYKDVLPYEENRVKLTPSRDNKFGYVNASHITATVGTHQRFYIAAQGPLPHTVHSFWQMVWEADVYLMVMLCGLQEEGVTPYCPAPGDRGLELGEFQVWRQFSQETGHCITTKLRLYHTSSRRMRGVWHLQYMEWGDQGCPHSVGHFLGFLEELSSVRQHTVSEIAPGHNRNPPVLVHCSAGVGRTGVTILSDLLLYTLDHNQELDVPRVTASLRHQRMLMVQTVAQYRFIYTLLIYYLKHSRLI